MCNERSNFKAVSVLTAVVAWPCRAGDPGYLRFELIGTRESADNRTQNVIGPDEALNRLKQGNRRYAEGKTRRLDFVAERPILAGGQNPFAAILGCAYSRVGPEYAFEDTESDIGF